VSIETGKIVSEGQGEVQEMIDICDFATGLSRQLYGLTIASERPGHRMMETWHPLGVTGVISAFNFPVAVWAWNAALALVCGNPVIWKPSEKTPLTALAVQAIFERTAGEFERELGTPARGLLHVLIGGRAPAEALADHPRVALLSATGSTAMGRLLELGGNNGAIVCPRADQELPLRAIAFAAMGTAGQRCTTLRRLFVHRDLGEAFVERLVHVAATVRVDDPLQAGTLVGPLIDAGAYQAMQSVLAEAARAGGRVHGGEREHAQRWPHADPVPDALHGPGASDCRPQRGRRRAVVLDLHARSARGRALHGGRRVRLWSGQREHRAVRRRDRRRLWRREGNRRWARVRFRRLEGVHAPRHQHDQLFGRTSAGAGREVRHRSSVNFMHEASQKRV
jgi:aldehyde dehydrogenase (NAD+)